MIKKFLILEVALIMCIGLFTGCGSGAKFKVGYGQQDAFGYENSIVNSFDEFNAIFTEENLALSPELKSKIGIYNESYFSEKALLVCVLSGYAGTSYSVKSIEQEGKTIFVNVKKKDPKQSTQQMRNWTFLLEVKKSDILDATSIQVKI